MSTLPEPVEALYRELCGFLARKPCMACGRYGVEISHFYFMSADRVPGQKTVSRLPHRKNLAKLCCGPLCPECHRHGKRSIHDIGEVAFAEEHFGSEANMMGVVMRLLVEFYAQRELDRV